MMKKEMATALIEEVGIGPQLEAAITGDLLVPMAEVLREVVLTMAVDLVVHTEASQTRGAAPTMEELKALFMRGTAGKCYLRTLLSIWFRIISSGNVHYCWCSRSPMRQERPWNENASCSGKSFRYARRRSLCCCHVNC